MTQRIVILGSTGSIGRSALDIVRRHPDRFRVAGIGARANADLLSAQIHEFRPEYVAVDDEAAAAYLAALHPETTVWAGPKGLERLAGIPADVALCAVVGAAALRPLLAAIDAGSRIALANKEALVMAGRVVMERARRCRVTILPVDSEHNAIFQCIEGRQTSDVRRIYLTASGGPFYGRSRDVLREVSPEQATRHPTWDMGAKISVDSATLMNKGLEVIEAMWLFDMPLERIEIVIHPQSVVHGLVEFSDGSLLAHMGITDMRLPILFALTWPERVQSTFDCLDLKRLGALTFAEPDLAEFPCLRLALRAAAAGGGAPATLNAANEVAVDAFRRRRIGFLQIEDVVRGVLDGADAGSDETLETIEAADAAARARAEVLIAAIEDRQEAEDRT